MGLFSKVSEMRMKDPAEGTLRVVGITMPDPTATSANYRLDGVVSASGLAPTAVVHHGVASASHWPSIGDELPVAVDRSKPERLVIHWKTLPTGQQRAQSEAERLAAQMRGDAAAASAAGPYGHAATQDLGNGISVTAGPGVTINVVRRETPPTTSFGGPGQPVGAYPDPSPASAPIVSAADILARGAPGHATLLGSFPVDQAAVKPAHTMVGLMLNVMIDGHAPFQVQNMYAVPDDKVARLSPGALLPVRADLSQTGMVAVDWAAVG